MVNEKNSEDYVLRGWMSGEDYVDDCCTSGADEVDGWGSSKVEDFIDDSPEKNIVIGS